MDTIDFITNYIYERTTSLDRTVRGIWNVQCLFQPTNNYRTFMYDFIISQTNGQGCAYSNSLTYNIDYFNKFIGKDFLRCDIDDIALTVSLLDSVCNSLPQKYKSKCYQLTSDSETKMKWRTDIIFNESEQLLNHNKSKKILNVGVVGDIIKKFVDNEYDICGSDFDKSIVGMNMFDKAPIYNGNQTLDLIANADLAIITGMTITTLTIDKIIDCALKNNTKTIIFAETAPSLAPFYLDNGIDIYISEYFPFYIFNGNSKIKLYKR